MRCVLAHHGGRQSDGEDDQYRFHERESINVLEHSESLTTPFDAPDKSARRHARSILFSATVISLADDRQQWLLEQLSQFADNCDNRFVDIAMGLCVRRLGQNPVYLTDTLKQELARSMPGWNIDGCAVDALARMLLLTGFNDDTQLAIQLRRLLRHADVKEQLSFFKGLPLYPASPELNDLIADGLRSNVSDVFESIAHHNPYPAWHLDTHRFNHMVLKALFIDSSLEPIVGLQERNNPELAQMLLNTARERLAASRPVNSQLWALALPYMTSAERQEFASEIPS